MKDILTKTLKQKIAKSEIISFDIFDTLIKRFCQHSYDIFEMVEIKYNHKYPQNKIIDFKNERIVAETKARKKNNLEITLDDIYKELPSNLNKNELKKMEIEAEYEMCFPNEEIMEVYQYCQEKKKTIIIVSDMYLDKKSIASILAKNKITYNELFVSSNIKFKKSNGQIYDYILRKYNISSHKIFHIGDNIKSDYLIPKLKGIKSFLYKNNQDKNEKNYKFYFLNQFINFQLKNNNDDYYKFGYRNLGSLLFGFCNYIKENINPNDKIFFLAREGKIINECFDIMYPNFNTSYLYVSRKSITSSFITNFKDFNDLINNQSITRNETLKMFLKRTGLYNNKNINYFKANNIDINKSLEENQLFLENNFNILKNNVENHQSYLETYLKEMGFNKDAILVDIGWAGTMQDILQKNLGFKNIKGYYLGVRTKKYNKNKNGYLYNNNENLEIKYRSMNGLLELIFASNHGSTVGYTINNNKIKPLFMENELSPTLFNKILKIQNGAKDFIKDYQNLNYKLNLTGEEYSHNILQTGLFPTKEDINLFKDFNMYDEKTTFLIGNNKFNEYIFHPKKFINDYIESGWKNAFLKNIFKIEFPYWRIYYLLCKIKR